MVLLENALFRFQYIKMLALNLILVRIEKELDLKLIYALNFHFSTLLIHFV